MRGDLNKLLCERERLGHGMDYGEHRQSRSHDEKFDCEFDDEPFTGVGSGHREGMKRRYGYDTKQFNENLNPLWGFIRKSVGKKWDRVYSEICSVFDKRSVINQHILIHLEQKVEINDIRVGADGKLYVFSPYRWHYQREHGLTALRESSIEYYVDPRDGILKYNHQRLTYRQENRLNAAKRAKEEAKVRRVVDKFTELHLIKGVWFEVKFIEREPHVFSQFEKSQFSNRSYYRTYYKYEYEYDILKERSVTDARVAVSKRTLSKKEIKKHDLR